MARISLSAIIRELDRRGISFGDPPTLEDIRYKSYLQTQIKGSKEFIKYLEKIYKFVNDKYDLTIQKRDEIIREIEKKAKGYFDRHAMVYVDSATRRMKKLPKGAWEFFCDVMAPEILKLKQEIETYKASLERDLKRH